MSSEEQPAENPAAAPPPRKSAGLVALRFLWVLVVFAAMFAAGEKTGRMAGRNQVLKEWNAQVAADIAAEKAANAANAKLYTVPDRVIARGGPATGKADYEWQPPYQMQKSVLAAVYFAEPDEVLKHCGKNMAACQWRDGARKPLLVLPNPCSLYEPYALTVCHEIGHAHGWPADHRGGHFIPQGSDAP